MKATYLTEKTQNGIDTWSIKHPLFQAKISSHGGHVLSFEPTGHQDLLWLSDSAHLDGSKAIRGGIPICWPWFGPSSGQYEGHPQHGYARTCNWTIVELEESNEVVKLKLIPQFSVKVQDLFPFELAMTISLSNELEITLHTKNKSDSAQPLSQAIHTYFAVSNINNSKLKGMENSQYEDKLTGKTETQNGAIELSEAADRVYLTDACELVLADSVREIRIGGVNHDSVVVWNPWLEGAKGMSDFDDEGYKTMICVEMANTQGLELAPGENFDLTQSFSIAT